MQDVKWFGIVKKMSTTELAIPQTNLQEIELKRILAEKTRKVTNGYKIHMIWIS